MNILLLPLLAVHVLFLAYALVKRVLNVFSTSSERYARPPKHLALVVVPGSSRSVPLSLIRQHEDEAAFVSSVETALDHCAALRIPELSIWDTGRGMSSADTLTPGLTQRCMNRLENSVMAVDKLTGGTHSPRRVCERRAEDQNMVETWHVEISSEFTRCTSSPAREKDARVAVHFLPAAASSSYIATIAQEGALDEATLDKRVQQALHFEHDPELLVIHHLRPGVGLRRSAPELYGYPFWPLRITEI
jgi:hypothetical protein